MVKYGDGPIAIREPLAPTFFKQFHEGIDSRWKVLETNLAQHFYVLKLSNISKVVCERCTLGAKNNPRQGPRAPHPQVQSVGGILLENLVVDFTKMPWDQGYKYLLVFVCTFSGWTEKAPAVARCLLKEIIPQFGIPVSIGSDNGPALWQRWHCWWLRACKPPGSCIFLGSLGKVECMNRPLKLHLGKPCQETHLQWDQLLPIASHKVDKALTL
jgi:hypothetical protein